MQDHIVLISGASAGIGQATARRFHQAGARVLLAARRRDRLDALVAELGERAHAFELDVTQGAAVEAFFAALPPALEGITVLVNNAGAAYGMAPSQEADFAQWQATVELNVTALLRLTHSVLPGMVARRRGHIINLGSVAGTYPYPGGNVYGASKAFVEQFCANLRCDLHGQNVRVTNIEPGLVETEFSLVRFAGDAQRAAAVYQGVEPMRPEDIADAIFWCARTPERVNVNRIEMMATTQSAAGFRFYRPGE